MPDLSRIDRCGWISCDSIASERCGGKSAHNAYGRACVDVECIAGLDHRTHPSLLCRHKHTSCKTTPCKYNIIFEFDFQPGLNGLVFIQYSGKLPSFHTTLRN